MVWGEGDAGDRFLPGAGGEAGFEAVALRDSGPSRYPNAPQTPDLGLSYGMYLAVMNSANVLGASTVDARFAEYTSNLSLIYRLMERHQISAGVDFVWSSVTFAEMEGWDQVTARGAAASYLFFLRPERRWYLRAGVRYVRPEHTSGAYPLLPVMAKLGVEF